MNARIVTQERTIVGLRTVKNAVKFHNPENCRLEKIPLTDGLLTAVRFAHMHYKKRLDEEECRRESGKKEGRAREAKTRDQIVAIKGIEPRQKGAGANDRKANS